ncbi:TRAP-type C4-dicarboxylate transport system permease small subunit [Hasllibacter halocynthiae]|uniref:TRAP transporter small permease protein n=1 Tax=Hasllibacter halocynthiae TaxID=595589 RepID=A0A2T0X339_9RHOB|nr:TRAP transporter small permease subunit [Hasllibacter halocynthiae]PRY93315.1 TRAP-type C4-dicarboxylate transport system permease small subunit [Hasllibacter halocynthiae]
MRRAVEGLALALALAGGAVLLALIALVVSSVAGRELAEASRTLFGARVLGQVPGDYELLEAGAAFAIFAFLPICQLRGGHATVDVFTSRLPPAAQRWLAAFWEVTLAGAIVLITWRLWEGTAGKLPRGAWVETTFILQFPVWWAYAAAFAAACGASLVALWCAGARVADAAAGDPATGS